MMTLNQNNKNGRVHGKVALVTGGAKGIGAASVRVLAAEGAQVLISDLDVEAGQALAAEIGPAAAFIRHDVSSEDAWRQVIDHVRERYGRLDILVNNAGILIAGSIEETSLQAWQQVMRVNADSVFLGCREGIALMKGSGGSIINLSSVAALAGRDDYLAYSASKGAVAALSRSVAALCRRRRYRIRCNTLHPDGVLTDMTRGSLPAGVDPDRMTIDSDPMNRMCRPEDVAASVLFLASDEARAINGVELRIDSGQMVMSI
ncbi:MULTISPECIES: SDR family oxidoreductase [Pseudomonas]|jgi:3(or 17)beta-hydroxysteroid dehydrogenase|uniref:3-beta-hydroxysteroid dehydrogenase n=1 Tax=Pseudomonas fluorescens TaxID=294 RepID=A0A5E7VRB7_PSEFL|nr:MULTISPECIES: SDR family oxidoreductase [Pseudomonas]QCY13017.1 SDR family oxidoreductase [Pseudomonas sp. MPC6]VVP81616.1 3-beta-hydroxysteroid dehydrogenase [Pseudomonas fluorescens]VVQ25166.1 3-beta-hydroxysteroid dehydrogenase [Pseudomonas fluorescens]